MDGRKKITNSGDSRGQNTIKDELGCSSCNININKDMKMTSPIVTPLDKMEYIEPTASGNIVIPHGREVYLRCAEKFAKPFDGQTLKAKCVGDKNFIIDGKVVKYENIKCNSMQRPFPMRTGMLCSGGTELLKVAHQFPDGVLPTINVCFDENYQKTSYAEHTIYPGTKNCKHNVPRENYITGEFFRGVNVDECYIYIYLSTCNVDIWSTKVDQIYWDQQIGTCHFVNVAPQWNSFKHGNWFLLANCIREFANNYETTLLCWTGVCGICTLPDINGVQRELYLNLDEQNNRTIPVPKLFFRILIDSKSREGIVIVGVNNPYLTIEKVRTGGYVVAKDISNDINCINWDKANIEKGYCYACSVPDFIAVVKDLSLEKLETTGVLNLKK
ncbi:uncharacterized protein LOC114804266 [Zeugodacus cucurbitae]|uniref:uncharacterized protein LOC114804266 n=1 Tax=Zeugodacus cucurbitae TaxID=28588 RepID=UPI0023D93330|nr:uncharacterized protein LOC114804266 [Zeugodacus cucurbitae]